MTAGASDNTTPDEDLARATLGRRALLRGALAGVAGLTVAATLGGCADAPTPRVADSPGQPATATAPATPSMIAATPGIPRATAVNGGTAVTVAASPVGSVIGTPAGAATTSAGIARSPVAVPSTQSKVLLAYFSRAGENYYYGGRTQLAVGNTAVLAGMISQLIGCDVYRIEATEPYSDDYEATVARNVREQQANARPAIANLPISLASYDTVLLGSPIWNVRPPLIMATFAGRFDFVGKTIFPLVTYAVSGLGTAARDYAAWCPGAALGESLAVRGEEVGEAGAGVEAWLRRVGLLKG